MHDYCRMKSHFNEKREPHVVVRRKRGERERGKGVGGREQIPQTFQKRGPPSG